MNVLQKILPILSTLLLIAGCGGETNPERQAAAWVLENGGDLQATVDGQATEIPSEAGLPSGNIEVTGVSWDIYPGDRNPKVTDAEIKRFQQLPHLKTLDLWASDVTDAGLAEIAKITTLEQLILTDTNITDAGLKHLEALKSLKDLSLIGTKATKPGTAQLKRTLPTCRIRQ
jgi:hypothetical protein